MSIKIEISGRSPLIFTSDQIALGSDPSCAVSFPDASEIQPVHAVIKEVDGRWMIEACKAESPVVSNGQSARVHWLKPGDVIQLTRNSPLVTFELTDDDDEDFLPLVPRFAEESVPGASKQSDAITQDCLLTDTVEISSPLASPSGSGVKESKSGTIKVPKSSPSLSAISPPASGTMKSSGTVKSTGTAKSSGTVKTVPKATDGSPKSSRSDAELAARRTKSPGSSGQIPTHKGAQDEDQIAPDVPVLSRMSASSWDEAELPPAPRSRRSKDQDELKWILSVVGRCVGIGGGALVVLLLVSTIWKALTQPAAGLPTATVPPENSTVAASGTAIAPAQAGAYIPPARPKSKPVEPSTINQGAEPVIGPETDAAAGVSETELADAGDPDENTSMLENPDAPDSGDAADSSANQTITEGSSSPVIQATTGSVYALVLENADETETIRIGTAWAASEQHLVTSASVATAINAYQKKGYRASAVHPMTDRSIEIKRVRIHANYPKAVTAAATEKNNEKRFAQARAAQLRYNLAVLDISPAEPLEDHLIAVAKPLKTTSETVYAMVGFPMKSATVSTRVSDIAPLQECLSKRASPITPGKTKDQVLPIKFPPQTVEIDWSGSPVLNKDNQVIGVYAQLPSSKSGDGKRGQVDHGVVWLGLLREVAPDLQKPSAVDMDDRDR